MLFGCVWHSFSVVAVLIMCCGQVSQRLLPLSFAVGGVSMRIKTVMIDKSLFLIDSVKFLHVKVI